MRKLTYILFCFLLFCFTGLGYFGGIEYTRYEVTKLKEQDTQYAFVTFLTQLENCLVTSQNYIFNFHFSKNTQDAVDAVISAKQCRNSLDQIGPQIEDAEMSFTLGEVALFYDGYLGVLEEYMLKQAALIKLHEEDSKKRDAEEQKLAEVLESSLKSRQKKLLKEGQLFIKKMQSLIIKTRLEILEGVKQDDNETRT